MHKVTDSVWITLLAIPHVGNPAITRNITLYNLLAPETQYIAFMDSDDLFADTHSLNSLVNALRENPEAKASFGGLAQISAEGELSSGPRGLKKAGSTVPLAKGSGFKLAESGNRTDKGFSFAVYGSATGR